MATPISMKRGPSQQGRTPSQQGPTPSQLAAATPPTSTPFSNPAQAAFSPRGQRSSPQAVKKSPATSNLMGQPNIGALNFDSPSAAAAMGALGIGGGFDIGLDNVGGLDTLGVAFANEDDKLKRLDTILKLLNQKKGFVSEAGVERIAQRLGLELLSEEQTTPGGRKMKTLAIAGSAISLDIVLDNNIVQTVSLAYHGNATSVSKHMDAASQILLQDLQLSSNQSPLTKTLDKFASNFEHVANLDKLSVIPGLDCFEALAGLHISLERLHQWDLDRLRADPMMGGKSDQYLLLSAMCSKHGLPAMHTRGRIGLALQYWRERHFSPPDSVDTTKWSDENEQVWSLRMSCAQNDSLTIGSTRVSEDWISKAILKPSIDPMNPMLDWQEPPNVTLPVSEENKNSGLDVLQLNLAMVPRVMFMVTFDPPVILPQTDWMRLYSYTGVTPPNPNATADFGHRPPPPPPTFDGLFFPIPSGSKQDPSEPRTITRLRDVDVYDRQGDPSTRRHKNTLFIYKPIYSQELTEMPFSHPQQLISMLPLLRQFAFLSSLLNNSFGAQTKENAQGKASGPKNRTQNSTAKEMLETFLNSGAEEDVGVETAHHGEPSRQDMDLDVILWVHPAPHLQVVFPLRDATANITFRILEGGTVEIMNENVLGPTGSKAIDGKGVPVTRDGLGRVLEHLEDLCKWAEWIRIRL